MEHPMQSCLAASEICLLQHPVGINDQCYIVTFVLTVYLLGSSVVWRWAARTGAIKQPTAGCECR